MPDPGEPTPDAVELRGRVACVTGAASGIGRATATALARLGGVVVAIDIDGDGLASLADEVAHSVGAAHIVTRRADVTEPEEVAGAFDAIGRDLGRLDALVTAAGVFPRIALADTDVGRVGRVLSVNVVGTIGCVLAALPLMAARGGGSAVLLTSGSGRLGAARSAFQRGFAVYGASKAALDRWAIGVADEAAELGVAINVLCPGAMVRTPGVAALALADDDRVAGTPTIDVDDVATAIVHLASYRPDDATGRRLVATEFRTTWPDPASPS